MNIRRINRWIGILAIGAGIVAAIMIVRAFWLLFAA